MQQVVIATHNHGKMEEFKVLLEALGLDFCCLNDFQAGCAWLMIPDLRS